MGQKHLLCHTGLKVTRPPCMAVEHERPHPPGSLQSLGAIREAPR